jgi:hypothetical protein
MQTTLWGVPAAAAHDPQRGISCFGGIGAGLGCQGGGLSDGEPAVPFITMPSGCSTSPVSTVWADSWQEPGRYVQAQSALPTMSSCDRSVFWPELSLRPETLRPEAADGVSLAIKVHEFEGSTVAAPELRDATITLPQGMAINPAVADGLQACPATGAEGVNRKASEHRNLNSHLGTAPTRRSSEPPKRSRRCLRIRSKGVSTSRPQDAGATANRRALRRTPPTATSTSCGSNSGPARTRNETKGCC